MYSNYLLCPYVEGARGPFDFDCWGMVRRCLLDDGIPENVIPEFGGITLGNGMHESYEAVKGFVQVDTPSNGSVICAFNADDELRHIGYFTEGKVLHTNIKMGARMTSLKQFRRYGSLKYFDYR